MPYRTVPYHTQQKLKSELRDKMIRSLEEEKLRARDLYEALSIDIEDEKDNKGNSRKVLRRRHEPADDVGSLHIDTRNKKYRAWICWYVGKNHINIL